MFLGKYDQNGLNIPWLYLSLPERNLKARRAEFRPFGDQVMFRRCTYVSIYIYIYMSTMFVCKFTGSCFQYP